MPTLRSNKMTILSKAQLILSLSVAFVLVDAAISTVQANVIKQAPIIAKIQTLKPPQPLSKETKKWMKRWVGTNLEAPGFEFYELSGSTSINLKVHKIDPTDLINGYQAYGTFVTRGGSANFDIELAYYNLAAILGHDDIIRPAVRYSLGKKASAAFIALMEKKRLTITDPKDRVLVRIDRILNRIATTPSLLGCLKAKKHDSYAEYKSIADKSRAAPSGPLTDNPVIAALQAANPQPIANTKIELQAGYTGDLLQLAREYSIVMTLDAVFQQWDRYNGVNVGLARDSANIAHFYMTDNGGADMSDYLPSIKRNLNYFNRYDRKTIAKLKQLYYFLNNPARGFLGYKNAETFVVDLGLYSEFPPAEYIRMLKRNIQILLGKVSATERQYGSAKTYLP
jgi:hypothetical protein